MSKLTELSSDLFLGKLVQAIEEVRYAKISKKEFINSDICREKFLNNKTIQRWLASDSVIPAWAELLASYDLVQKNIDRQIRELIGGSEYASYAPSATFDVSSMSTQKMLCIIMDSSLSRPQVSYFTKINDLTLRRWMSSKDEERTAQRKHVKLMQEYIKTKEIVRLYSNLIGGSANGKKAACNLGVDKESSAGILPDF